MKLKKMEITGFKSFVEKSGIEFPKGISAIVGPNGCGKSNIVDALRWAMGEQSIKQLRGKNKEDIIFAGTNGRPPMNMAEVSLILSNNNGSAPEEFKDLTEIMVTRRLYRSGESAYLINRQPCRLKDIHNIFLGSGMGAKSYAVIQQGNIGAITDAGPDERRFFIEEAAGITRYKQRKKEALRKVDSTNQNLLRISDIVTEVERQMGSLKRQARKAERYKIYQERARKLDVLLALHYYEDYARQIRESDALLNGLKDADIQHISKIRELDAAVEDIKLKRWQKNQEISAQKSDRFNTQRTIDKMENDLSHLRGEVERLATEADELRKAHQELEGKNQNIMSEVAQVETQQGGIEAQMLAVRSDLSQEHLKSQDIRNQLSESNQDIERGKAHLMDLVAQEAKYQNIFQNTSNNKDSLKRRLRRVDEDVVLAGRKVTDFESGEAQATEEVELCRQELEELNQEIESIRESLDEKSKALGEQVRHAQTLELERNKAKSKYSTLKKMEDNFEWYKGGVKAIMKCKEGDDESLPFRRQSVLGLAADILEPAPSFETAVEAVLGESLQYILVENQATSADAIRYLRDQGAGRSGFIPVSSVRPMGGNAASETRNLKPLLDHVAVKPGFETAAEALLGHVLVAENMDAALAAGNEAQETIVTKAGDIVSPHGMMIGGSKENLSVILSKKQELRDLEQRVADLDQDLETARQDQKSAEAEVRSAETDLQKQIEQRYQATQDETDAEKALYKVTEDLKHARRHLELVRLEQEQLTDEESGIDEEIERYDKVLLEVGNEVKAAQEKVAMLTQKISDISSEMEAFDHKIVDLKLRQTTLNAQLENAGNSLRRLRQFHEDGMNRLEQLSRDILLKDQKRVRSEQKITEYGHKLSEMYEVMRLLDQALEQNEADYQDIDAKLRANDNSISDIQSRREDLLQKIRVLELEQSQRQIKQENIANQLTERYHRPLDEFMEEADGAYLEISPDQTETELAEYRKKLANIGDVNLGAIKEYEELRERFDFLCEQRDDLLKAIDDLHKVIRKINKITQEKFLITFNQVNEKLEEVFPRLFDGGTAKLILTDPSQPLDTGVEFMVHPPGKKLTRLSLLSGGEKALSAIAFIFAIFLIKPASFCIMDEIDAPLDDANVFRFNELLKIIGRQSQIIMITHKRKSMEFADTLFGITMEKKGVSKIVSVTFESAAE